MRECKQKGFKKDFPTSTWISDCQFDMTEHESKHDYLVNSILSGMLINMSAILSIITRCGIIYGGERDKGHVCATRSISSLNFKDLTRCSHIAKCFNPPVQKKVWHTFEMG